MSPPDPKREEEKWRKLPKGYDSSARAAHFDVPARLALGATAAQVWDSNAPRLDRRDRAHMQCIVRARGYC